MVNVQVVLIHVKAVVAQNHGGVFAAQWYGPDFLVMR